MKKVIFLPQSEEEMNDSASSMNPKVEDWGDLHPPSGSGILAASHIRNDRKMEVIGYSADDVRKTVLYHWNIPYFGKPEKGESGLRIMVSST